MSDSHTESDDLFSLVLNGLMSAALELVLYVLRRPTWVPCCWWPDSPGGRQERQGSSACWPRSG